MRVRVGVCDLVNVVVPVIVGVIEAVYVSVGVRVTVNVTVRLSEPVGVGVSVAATNVPCPMRSNMCKGHLAHLSMECAMPSSLHRDSQTCARKRHGKT